MNRLLLKGLQQKRLQEQRLKGLRQNRRQRKRLQMRIIIMMMLVIMIMIAIVMRLKMETMDIPETVEVMMIMSNMTEDIRKAVVDMKRIMKVM